MKTIKSLALLCAAIFLMSIVSCSKDDSEKIKGDEAVAWIKGMVLDDDSKVLYFPTQIDGVYEVYADDKDLAYLISSNIINQKYSGDNYIYTLPDNRGDVKISQSDESGCYYSMYFNVSGLEKFQLNIMNTGVLEKENDWHIALPYKIFKCNDCGRYSQIMSYRKLSPYCLFCKSLNVVLVDANL